MGMGAPPGVHGVQVGVGGVGGMGGMGGIGGMGVDLSLGGVAGVVEVLGHASAHYVRYAVNSLLLFSEVSLQQGDLVVDALQLQMASQKRRAEMLELLLLEAKRKAGDYTMDKSATDVLREKVIYTNTYILLHTYTYIPIHTYTSTYILIHIY
jgi:hypothetical protein